ncbi:MAG: FAD-dependent oxidoreductase, partial [Nocardioidaceae bacterium]
MADMTGSAQHKRLVVVGGGMVAHRLVEALRDRDRDGDGVWHVDVFAEESRPPYDRVALTSFFSGRDPEDLLLGGPDLWHQPEVRLHTNSPVREIDTEQRQVHARGRVYDYDALVLATGSSPAVPPVPGADLPGCFVYRTVDDVTELRAWVADRGREHGRTVRGAVVGGGLLGLEAAG